MSDFYWRGLKNSRTRFGEITVKIFGLQATPGPQRLIRPGGQSCHGHNHCGTKQFLPGGSEGLKIRVVRKNCDSD